MSDTPLQPEVDDGREGPADARAGGVVVERPVPGIVVLALSGEHDVYTASHLGETLARLAGEANGVVVDVAEATFLDSTVLRVLFDGLRAARQSGHGFAVAIGAPPAPEVARVFEISGVTRLLPTYAERDDAVRAAHAA